MKKVFKFSAVMANGVIVNDYIKTDNITLAKKLITDMGYSIKYIEWDPIKTIFSFHEKKIPLSNLKEIVAVFYNTIKQGISPGMIVDTLPEMFTGYTKKQAYRIKTLIQTQGLPLSKVFELIGMSTFIVKAIENAERESGNLEDVLGKVVMLLDVLLQGDRKLRLALINPKIILTIITLIIYVVYGFAMKKAIGFFQANLTYGTITKIIIKITELINLNIYVSGFIVILIIIGIWKLFTSKTIFAIASFPGYLKYKFPNWKNNSITKSLIDGVSFVLRPFVALQENYETMKICYFIDLLYSSGVKPDIIIQYLVEIVDSKHMKKMLYSTLPNIRGGMPFYEAFKLAGFKQDFVGFLKAGAETTQLEYYMVSFAEIKRNLFERSIFAISTILPIIMLLFASSFIIFTFAGIYLPMLNFK